MNWYTLRDDEPWWKPWKENTRTVSCFTFSVTADRIGKVLTMFYLLFNIEEQMSSGYFNGVKSYAYATPYGFGGCNSSPNVSFRHRRNCTNCFKLIREKGRDYISLKWRNHIFFRSLTGVMRILNSMKLAVLGVFPDGGYYLMQEGSPDLEQRWINSSILWSWSRCWGVYTDLCLRPWNDSLFSWDGTRRTAWREWDKFLNVPAVQRNIAAGLNPKFITFCAWCGVQTGACNYVMQTQTNA